MSDALDIFVRDLLTGRYLAYRDLDAIGLNVLPPEPSEWVVHQWVAGGNADPFVAVGTTYSRMLIVGGGGAGGGGVCGGGGGAGGVRWFPRTILRGGTFDVFVGVGGSGIDYGGVGGNGGISQFGADFENFGVLGGGGGAAYYLTAPYGDPSMEIISRGPSSGASGGGGAENTDPSDPPYEESWKEPGLGYWHPPEEENVIPEGAARGYDGGHGAFAATYGYLGPAGGGGGGACYAGVDAVSSFPGNGGDGLHCDILFGPTAPEPGAKYWGGGGGGATKPHSYYYGAGGDGGAGGGGDFGGQVWANEAGKVGTNNLGGGGGGGGFHDAYHEPPDYAIDQAAGGNGGAGTVILRYRRSRSFRATGGDISYYTASGELIA